MNSPDLRPRWSADLALATIALIWGATFVTVKQALADVSTILFLALRFALAAGALALALRGRYGAFLERPRAVTSGVFAGFFLFAGYAFQTAGLRYTTPSKSAFITGLSIVLVPLVASLVYKRAPRIAEGFGVMVAAAGMGLLTLEDLSLRVGYGDLLTLCCAVAFAVHIVAVGHFSQRFGFEGLSVVQITSAAVFSMATFWWIETPQIRWTTSLLIALAVTGLLATALAFTVQAWAQKHTTATRTALIFALEPVFAWITSYIVAGETLSNQAVTGAILILAGIVLVELKPLPGGEHP
jgi:drug/metabolite transporter (DMT)-like permease